MGHNWKCILVGGVGGMMPTLCRLGATYVTNPSEPLPKIGLLFGLSIFFIISSFLVLCFSESDLKKAICLGIAAPGIITNICNGVNSPYVGNSSTTINSQKKSENTSFIEGTAYALDSLGANAPSVSRAQESISHPSDKSSPDPKPSIVRSVTVSFKTGNAPSEVTPSTFIIKQTATDGMEYPIGKFEITPGTILTPLLRTDTASVTIISGNLITTQKISLDVVHCKVVVDLTYKPSNDFLWALGFSRKMQIVSIKSEITEIQKAKKKRRSGGGFGFGFGDGFGF